MCGIAGYLGRTTIESGRLEKCLKFMGRRGPDHQTHQHWITPSGKNLYFLHTRLDIIDLNDRANQPIYAGSKVMVYNGELYNYLELRSDLSKRGQTFETQSDTEVLLKSIDFFGWEVLDRFEGMWAFVVYDKHDGSVTLCRDRFGEKPLYIHRTVDGIFFGSEVKFLAELSGKRFPVNFDHVYRYLVNGYKALYKQPSTFFTGVSELSPASSVRIDDTSGELQWGHYWTPALSQREMSYDEAVAGARERLIGSVKLRLRADVPLAFCMSGGVDSNALISIAKRVFNYDVHGFTIANSDERYEEQDLVDYAVQELGIRHTSIPVDTTRFLPRLRTLVQQHDAPVYTITYFAHWFLMESIAAHGYRISLSGTAADELFTGYYDHHLAYLYEVRNDAELSARSLGAWSKNILPMVRNPFLQDPMLFVDDPEFRRHIYLNADEFAGYLQPEWSEPFRETHYTDSLLRNRMLNEIFHEATPVILHEDDLNAMYFSVENRSPFLDRNLFEFCNSIPSRHLIQEGYAKAVLRDSMKGIVPERILQSRRKVGFNAPIFSFLDVRNPEVRSALLDRSPIFEHIRRDKIENLIEKASLPNSESKFLFYFVSAKMFVEEFAS